MSASGPTTDAVSSRITKTLVVSWALAGALTAVAFLLHKEAGLPFWAAVGWVGLLFYGTLSVWFFASRYAKAQGGLVRKVFVSFAVPPVIIGVGVVLPPSHFLASAALIGVGIFLHFAVMRFWVRRLRKFSAAGDAETGARHV